MPQVLARELGQRAMAVVLEGKIKSAFDPSQSAAGRLLVISSSQFLANPFARAGNPPTSQGTAGSDEDLQMLSLPYAQKYLTPTILVLKNILDWMSMSDDLHACARGR